MELLVGSLSDLFSNTLDVLSSVTVRDMLKLKALVSHVYKTIKTTLFILQKNISTEEAEKQYLELRLTRTFLT